MDLEIAERLVSRAAGKAIPVRIDIRRARRCRAPSRGKHFSRGLLMSVNGRNLMIKPFKHSGNIEIMDPEFVNPWKTKIIENGLYTEEEYCREIEGDMIEQTELLEKIENASPSNRYVIADMGDWEGSRVIRFYGGKNKAKFFPDLDKAMVYEGATVVAKRALGRMKASEKMRSAVTGQDYGNLTILPYEAAERYLEQLQAEEISPQTTIPFPVAADEEDPVREISQSDDVQQAIKDLQVAINSVQTATQLLKEERLRLEKARERLVRVIVSQMGEADEELEAAEESMAG